jgi:hypothetical protein
LSGVYLATRGDCVLREELAVLLWRKAGRVLSGTVRRYVDRLWQAAAFDAELIAAAERKAQGTDALALIELALVELDRSAASAPRPRALCRR